MAKTKVSVRNLRVYGQRIPDGIFRQIADEMLPGPQPTANELKNGKQSKAQMWAAICETDAESRKATVNRAKELMSRKAKRDAADAGYTIADTRAVADDGWPRTADGERDYVAQLAKLKAVMPPELLLSEPERTALFKAAQDGITDPFERERLMQAAKKAAGIVDPTRAIMGCNYCGKFPATERPDGGWYCARHFQAGAAAAPSAPQFTFGNTLVTPELPARALVYQPIAAPVRPAYVADFGPSATNYSTLL